MRCGDENRIAGWTCTERCQGIYRDTRHSQEARTGHACRGLRTFVPVSSARRARGSAHLQPCKHLTRYDQCRRSWGSWEVIGGLGGRGGQRPQVRAVVAETDAVDVKAE